MKRILWMLSIVVFSLSARSQNFSVSPSIVTTGSDVTLTALSESTIDHYTSIASVTLQQPNSNVTVTIKSTSFFTSQSNPTKIVVTLTNSGSSAATVNLVIDGYVANDANQSSMEVTGNANQQIQINPASATYYNTAASVTLNKQGCGGGSMGSAVTYTVPANKYSSTVSQADAQSKATNDLNTNGQNYANANGQCIPVYARLQGTIDDGEGSWVIAHYYADAACTIPLALPAPLTHYVTWTKYYAYPDPRAGQQYTVTSQYTASAGATYFSFGHREFYSTVPPTTIYSDWVASVVLQSDNPAYTAEPNSGVFTNN